MAEYCLKCWNELNGTNDNASKYIISKELDFCEGCQEWKNVIIVERKFYYLHKLRFIIFPFKVICIVLFVLWRILIFPYLFYTYRKEKNNKTKNQ